MNKKTKVTDYITSFLVAQGVTHVFEVIGGMTTHLVDSIYRDGKIRIISTHHEQAAVFAAEAMARISGVPGIAMATSGPGATNLLTGIGSCYFDSSPAIFFTGQVNRDEQKGNKPTRQLGFQETDIVRMAAPITKAAWCIQKPEEIPDLLINAFDLAVSGRPGPVLIDIPMDVQRATIEVQEPSKVSLNISEDVDKETIEDLIKSLHEAKRPLVLVGNGVRLSQSTDLFRQFIAEVKTPVVNSLMAVDSLPYKDVFRVGMIGTYGNRWANVALGRADLLLVLGSRLDIRQTGSDVDSFKSDRIIYHVDCDLAELNNRVKGCRTINANLNVFLSTILPMSKKYTFPYREEWISEIKEYKTKERLDPIEKWFNTQTDEIKSALKDEITTYGDVQYKLFIDGKTDFMTEEEKKKKEDDKKKIIEPKKSKPEDELLNVANINAKPDGGDKEDSDKETELASLKDIYSVEEGFNVIGKILDKK